MAFRIRRVDYFYTRVKDQPGEAYTVLSKLVDLGVNLLAFIGVPMGPEVTQLTLFPAHQCRGTDEPENRGIGEPESRGNKAISDSQTHQRSDAL